MSSRGSICIPMTSSTEDADVSLRVTAVLCGGECVRGEGAGGDGRDRRE